MNAYLTTNADSTLYYSNNLQQQDRYRLWINSKTVSYNMGVPSDLHGTFQKATGLVAI